MAKFKFRLQSYFQLKGKLENQRKLEYGVAMTELDKEKTKKEVIETERNNTVDLFKKNVETKIDAEAFKRYNYFISLCKKRIEEQERVILKAEKKVDLARNELVEAMKERKTLETLRDKEFTEFMKEEIKSEQKMSDEIVSYKFNKRNEGF